MKNLPTNALEGALYDLRNALEYAWAHGQILTESDLHLATAMHLRNALGQSSGWLVGLEHPLYDRRPDITCYRLPSTFSEFLKASTIHIRAIIEIKLASDLGDDLDKLEQFQKRVSDETGHCPIAWMVYADHFDTSIHAVNYGVQMDRKRAISSWSNRPSQRGASVIELGSLQNKYAHCEDVLLAFRDHWWHHD